MTQLPAVVTIPDLTLATTLQTSALFEAAQTTGGVGESVAVTFQQIASGVLSAVIVPVTSGGTNTSTLTDFGVVYGNGTATVGITAAGTAFWPLLGNGTASAPSFQQINLTQSITGVLSVPFGGTGTTALTAFGVPYGNDTSAVGVTSAGTAFWPLLGNGSALAPSFQQLNLTLSITGVLSVPFGGTGTSTLTEFGVTYGNGSSTIGITSAGTALWALVGNGTAAAPTFQQINLTQSATGVLTVPFGGTGTSTLIANRVLIGAGTSTIASSNIATTGWPLVGNGTSAAPGFAVLGVPGGGIGTGTTTPFAVLAGGTTATAQMQSLATTGASGLVLMSQGSAALPIWVTAGAGTLTGPAAVTTDSVPRWLTTTSLGTTNVTIDGSNNVTGIVTLGVAGTATFLGRGAFSSSIGGAITNATLAARTTNGWASEFYASASGISGGCINARVDFTTEMYCQFRFTTSIIGSIINTNGTGVAYNTSSDKDRKFDEHPFTRGREIIDGLQVWDFAWKPDKKARSVGLFAQDTFKIFPAAVTPSKEPGGWQMDNSKIVPILIAAVQELGAELDEVKLKVANSTWRH